MNARSLVVADKMAVAASVRTARKVSAQLKALMEKCTPEQKAIYEVALAGSEQAIEDGKMYLRGMP